MKNSLTALINESLDYLKNTWKFFLGIIIVLLLSISIYSYLHLLNQTEIVKKSFINILNGIEKHLDGGINYLNVNSTFFSISLKGELKNTSSEKLSGVNIKNSSFYRRIRDLETGKLFIMIFPDLVDAAPRVNIIKRYNYDYRVISVEPEKFFNIGTELADYIIVNNSEICIYSTYSGWVGDEIRLSFVSFIRGQLFLSQKSSAEKLPGVKIYVLQNITYEAVFIISLLIILTIMFSWIRTRSNRLQEVLGIVDFEISDLMLLIQGSIDKSIINKTDLTGRLEASLTSIENFLYDSAGRKYSFHETSSFHQLVDGMMDFILQLTIQSKIDADKLNESEKKYRSLIESTSEGFFITDQEFIIIDLNDSLCSMMGYSREEILGKTPWDFADDENRKIFNYQSRLVKDTTHRSYEVSLRKKSGENVPVFFKATTILDNSMNVAGSFVFITDITMRKEAEEARNISEKKFRSLFDNARDAIYISDIKGAILEANMVAESRLGYTRDELISMNFINLVPLDKRDKYLQKINSLKSERGLMFETVHIRKDGTTYPCEVNSRIIEIQGEDAVLSIERDIAQRKNTEAMLIQSEKMVSVGGLAAGIAHEINNPLGVILQGIQLVLNRFSPDIRKNSEAAEETGLNLENLNKYMEKRNIKVYLVNMREAGERAAKIVSNMLQFSKKSRSKLVHSDIHNIIENTIEIASKDYDLGKKYDFRSIKIKKDFDRNIPSVLCSESEIEQVLLNILKNSSQAFIDDVDKNKSPEMLIKTSADDKYLNVEIVDNGPGMDEDTVNRLFEPFYTTRDVGGGTGLGLYVSYFIVTNNHNGKISVESKPGSGAKFTVKLPLREDFHE